MRNAILHQHMRVQNVRDFPPFSSPEAALLLVSTKNHDLWPGPTPEVRDLRTSRHSAHVQSQVWQIWLVPVSFYCVFKANQNRILIGPVQRSWFLALAKRSPASWDENDFPQTKLSAPEGGVLPEKLGGGVRPASQNPYPIHDRNLR